MRLVCLECSAAYEAPDNLFGPQPREVRCNRCGYQWTVIGSRPEENATAGALSVGPAEASVPTPRSPALTSDRPRPAVAPRLPPEPPPKAAPLGSSRPGDTLAAHEPSQPAPVLEPSAESTRTLLAGGQTIDTIVAQPDPEEKRLSHELDFGQGERYRRDSEGGGGTRRTVLILLLLIILACIAAILFKTQIIAAIPALKPVYGQVGL